MFVPNVGSVYYFEFLPEFAKFNNTYVVLKRMTLDECKGESIDLAGVWYAAAGVDTNKYTADEALLKTSEILKLRIPDSDPSVSAVYAPLLHIAKVPDPTVKKYRQVSLGCHIGYIAADSERIPTAIDIMSEHMLAATGIVSDAKLFELGVTYLSDSQYAEKEAERDETLMSLKNYYSENVKLRKENSQLRTKLKYYEDYIKQLSTTVDEEAPNGNAVP